MLAFISYLYILKYFYCHSFFFIAHSWFRYIYGLDIKEKVFCLRAHFASVTKKSIDCGVHILGEKTKIFSLSLHICMSSVVFLLVIPDELAVLYR